MTRDVVGVAVDWILEQGGPVNHLDPRKALSVALLFTTSALRDVVLLGETWVAGAPGEDVNDVVDELVRAAEAYWGLGESWAGPEPRRATTGPN